MMKKAEIVKKVLFWTAVVALPGGTLLLAYKMGKDHRKIKTVLKKLRRKDV